MKSRKFVKPEKISVADSVTVFLNSARLDLINAVRSACRNKFPRTVAALDALSAAELEAVGNGGLLALPRPKISELEKAMKADKFVWS